MTDQTPSQRPDWRTKLKRFLLDLDARLDFAVFQSGKWAREIYERFTAVMDRFHVAGWRRWLIVEPMSEAATLGTGGLLLMLALAVPAFRETSDEDWLKKSELAVTFLDRYGNEIGNRGIKHNDSVPLEDMPDHLIKATLATEDRRFYDHFGIDFFGTFRALLTNARAGGVVQGGSHHHPAARQEFVPLQRTYHRAQDQRGLSRALAGNPSVEERDPQALSRSRLSGRRRLRGQRRGAILFRQIGARRDLAGGGDARRPVQGAEQIFAAGESAGGTRPRQCRARQSGRSRLHDRGPSLRRAAQSGDADRPQAGRLAELLSRLGVRRDAQAGRHLPQDGHRQLLRGAHRDRSEPAALRRARGRSRRCASTVTTMAPASRRR